MWASSSVMDSNTTLVKVKLVILDAYHLFECNSNTTLVKVKC